MHLHGKDQDAFPEGSAHIILCDSHVLEIIQGFHVEASLDKNNVKSDNEPSTDSF